MATTFTKDETLTAKENFQAFLDGQKESDYTLGDYAGTEEGDMKLYTELKLAVEKETKKIADFNTAKQAAFNELAQQHDQERQALATEWQGYEDNDYTIPQ